MATLSTETSQALYDDIKGRYNEHPATFLDEQAQITEALENINSFLDLLLLTKAGAEIEGYDQSACANIICNKITQSTDYPETFLALPEHLITQDCLAWLTDVLSDGGAELTPNEIELLAKVDAKTLVKLPNTFSCFGVLEKMGEPQEFLKANNIELPEDIIIQLPAACFTDTSRQNLQRLSQLALCKNFDWFDADAWLTSDKPLMDFAELCAAHIANPESKPSLQALGLFAEHHRQHPGVSEAIRQKLQAVDQTSSATLVFLRALRNNACPFTQAEIRISEHNTLCRQFIYLLNSSRIILKLYQDLVPNKFELELKIFLHGSSKSAIDIIDRKSVV